ncbi:MAG: BON domain-containing protein [Crinalium sp.]
MNKFITLTISSLLLASTVACNNASQTSADAPGTVQENPTPPAPESVKETKEDAASKLRREQLDADIRAREQRNNITGGDTERAPADLQSEVRSKLEANIRGSQLAINANDQGVVVITGTVPKAADKAQIDVLAKQIKGVKAVNTEKVLVAPATPQ